jgi:hypothetical protein
MAIWRPALFLLGWKAAIFTSPSARPAGPTAALTLMLLLGVAAGIFYYGPRRVVSCRPVRLQSGSRLETPQPGFLSRCRNHVQAAV